MGLHSPPESQEQLENTRAIRAAVESLSKSSKRLEYGTAVLALLTLVLIALTIALLRHG